MPTFLVKTGLKGGRAIVQTEELRVQYRQVRRPTGRRIGGMFTEVEDAGVDRSRFHVHVPNGIDGRGMERSMIRYVEVPALKVKDRVRTLREEDVAAIKEVDDQIAELQERLRSARDARERVLAAAFRHGKLLYAGDLQNLIR